MNKASKVILKAIESNYVRDGAITVPLAVALQMVGSAMYLPRLGYEKPVAGFKVNCRFEGPNGMEHLHKGTVWLRHKAFNRTFEVFAV